MLALSMCLAFSGCGSRNDASSSAVPADGVSSSPNASDAAKAQAAAQQQLAKQKQQEALQHNAAPPTQPQ